MSAPPQDLSPEENARRLHGSATGKDASEVTCPYHPRSESASRWRNEWELLRKAVSDEGPPSGIQIASGQDTLETDTSDDPGWIILRLNNPDCFEGGDIALNTEAMKKLHAHLGAVLEYDSATRPASDMVTWRDLAAW